MRDIPRRVALSTAFTLDQRFAEESAHRVVVLAGLAHALPTNLAYQSGIAHIPLSGERTHPGDGLLVERNREVLHRLNRGGNFTHPVYREFVQ